MSCNQWLWKDPLGGLQVPYASFKCAPCRAPDELHSCRLRLAASIRGAITPWSSRGRHRELVGMAASKLRSASWRGASRRRPNTIVLARSSSWSPYDLAGRRFERSQLREVVACRNRRDHRRGHRSGDRRDALSDQRRARRLRRVTNSLCKKKELCMCVCMCLLCVCCVFASSHEMMENGRVDLCVWPLASDMCVVVALKQLTLHSATRFQHL